MPQADRGRSHRRGACDRAQGRGAESGKRCSEKGRSRRDSSTTTCSITDVAVDIKHRREQDYRPSPALPRDPMAGFTMHGSPICIASSPQVRTAVLRNSDAGMRGPDGRSRACSNSRKRLDSFPSNVRPAEATPSAAAPSSVIRRSPPPQSGRWHRGTPRGHCPRNRRASAVGLGECRIVHAVGRRRHGTAVHLVSVRERQRLLDLRAERRSGVPAIIARSGGSHQVRATCAITFVTRSCSASVMS